MNQECLLSHSNQLCIIIPGPSCMLKISAFLLRIAFWGNCACFLAYGLLLLNLGVKRNLQAKNPDQQANIPDQQANIPDRGANKYDRRRFFTLKAFFHTKGKKHVFFGQRLKFWTSGRSRYAQGPFFFCPESHCKDAAQQKVLVNHHEPGT